jgi:hypothetical protein
MGFFPTDIGSRVGPRLSIPPGEFTAGVLGIGRSVDRFGYLSGIVTVSVRFVVVGSAPGDVVVGEVGLESSVDRVDWAPYKEFGSSMPIEADGEYSVMVVLPVNLSSASRFVRVVGRIDLVGVGVLDSIHGAGCVTLGGSVETPDSLWEIDGWVVPGAVPWSVGGGIVAGAICAGDLIVVGP